jgi:hypothetical protein
MAERQANNGPHDMGGLPAGPIEPSEHDLSYWERRIESMLSLCFRKGLLKDAAELRHRIEGLGPDAYEKMSYYERWAAALTARLTELDVVSEQEVEAKIAAIKARQ